jgi:hypothetical protein
MRWHSDYHCANALLYRLSLGVIVIMDKRSEIFQRISGIYSLIGNEKFELAAFEDAKEVFERLQAKRDDITRDLNRMSIPPNEIWILLAAQHAIVKIDETRDSICRHHNIERPSRTSYPERELNEIKFLQGIGRICGLIDDVSLTPGERIDRLKAFKDRLRQRIDELLSFKDGEIVPLQVWWMQCVGNYAMLGIENTLESLTGSSDDSNSDLEKESIKPSANASIPKYCYASEQIASEKLSELRMQAARSMHVLKCFLDDNSFPIDLEPQDLVFKYKTAPQPSISMSQAIQALCKLRGVNATLAECEKALIGTYRNLLPAAKCLDEENEQHQSAAILSSVSIVCGDSETKHSPLLVKLARFILSLSEGDIS